MVDVFTKREICPNLDEWEDSGSIPRDLHSKAAHAGLLGIGYPEEIGGSGGNLLDITVMTEALIHAGASGGLFAGLFSHGIAIPHVVDAMDRLGPGSEPANALLSDIVEPVLSGTKIAALGITEPSGGSDVSRILTRAEPDGDGWIINGSKTYITSGVRADVMVTAARVDGPGAAGIALFAIDTKTPGFNVSRNLRKMGWQCSDTAEISLTDVRVPNARRLTPSPGDGFASIARHFVAERLSLATLAYSTAARALDLSVSWCQERNTFGEPLISRQAVRHTLVDMHRQVAVARSFTRSCILSGSSETQFLDAVLAKNTAVQACDDVVAQAVQLHGGLGYMRGIEVERHYRDAKILGIGGGATDVMSDLAAKLLGW